ncbi:MAG: tail fiber domain-containing protein [Burkholderiales bacterium]
MNPKSVMVWALHAVLAVVSMAGAQAKELEAGPSPLLAIDRNREAVVERVVAQWGDALARAGAGITADQLREMLQGMRADQLFAASLVGSLDGLRDVIAGSLVRETEVKPSLLQAKALGDADKDVVYVPVTPCRLVETRGTFAAVYQGGGAFAPNEIRTYTLQGGNGVCLVQLPPSVTPSAVQMQVYGIPTTTGSGDIEILPQGSAFGSSASLVYLGNNAFTSSAVTTLANLGSKQISVQVRGGGAHVAIDVVGYFRTPAGGFVTSVATGAGLTGGPITSSGTIGLATTQLLPTVACSASQIAKWNGSAWICAADANSGGTVTSVASGTGLTGGPVTSSGTLSIASAYQLPQSCTNGQVPKSNGAGGWTCASDANGGGTVTSITAGNGLTGGTITTTGTIAVDTDLLASYLHKQGGNAFGTTSVIGTTDNNAIEVRANGARVMRYEPNATSPNVLGGHLNNSVQAPYGGQTIAGGGRPGSSCWEPATGTYTRSCANATGGNWSSVGGGVSNVASASTAFVGGGESNTAGGDSAVVGGGVGNRAMSMYSTIGGGVANSVGVYGTVAGGYQNVASGSSSAVGGGASNVASGGTSTVPGGHWNAASGDWSFAAGRRAKSSYAGAFMWADSTDLDFKVQLSEFTGGGTGWPNAANTFNARATGGVWFVTAVDGITGRPTAGVWVGAGSGTWNSTSDRAMKADFDPVDAQEILARVASLPIGTWSYRTQNPSIRHMGPVAQDFRAAFGLGENDTTIATVDADGVALAAIQGLNAKVEAQAREIAQLKLAHASEIAELKRAVEVLLARTSPEGRIAAR